MALSSKQLTTNQRLNVSGEYQGQSLYSGEYQGQSLYSGEYQGQSLYCEYQGQSLYSGEYQGQSLYLCSSCSLYFDFLSTRNEKYSDYRECRRNFQ